MYSSNVTYLSYNYIHTRHYALPISVMETSGTVAISRLDSPSSARATMLPTGCRKSGRTPLEIGGLHPNSKNEDGVCCGRSEEHTYEIKSPCNLVCRLLHA